jgi:hypothetical protein
VVSQAEWRFGDIGQRRRRSRMRQARPNTTSVLDGAPTRLRHKVPICGDVLRSVRAVQGHSIGAAPAVARALAEHRIGVGQQAHRRLARLRAGGIADPRDRREGRHAAFGDGSAGCLYRGGCDASRSGAETRPAPLTSLLWTGATLESRPPDPRIASVSGQSCLVRSNYVSNGKVWGPSTCHMSNYRERQHLLREALAKL